MDFSVVIVVNSADIVSIMSPVTRKPVTVIRDVSLIFSIRYVKVTVSLYNVTDNLYDIYSCKQILLFLYEVDERMHVLISMYIL